MKKPNILGLYSLTLGEAKKVREVFWICTRAVFVIPL